MRLGCRCVQSGGSTNVAEGGATETYDVVLTSEPTDGCDGDGIAEFAGVCTRGSLMFTAGNWDVPRRG